MLIEIKNIIVKYVVLATFKIKNNKSICIFWIDQINIVLYKISKLIHHNIEYTYIILCISEFLNFKSENKNPTKINHKLLIGILEAL